MTKNTFLTIGIPTWNRHDYLKKNLLALIAEVQTARLNDRVEILVSDNASEDETATLCQQLAHQHPFITYYRQEKNNGANANFQAVITLAQGHYVWLFGDDDLLVSGIMATIIQDMMNHAPDILVGPALFDDTQQKATHRSIRHLINTNQIIFSKNDMIGLAGKMSGLIFKRDSILPLLPLIDPIIQRTRTPWPHLAWVIVLLNDPTKKILLLPYGINQLVDQHWHNLLFDGKTLIKIHFIAYQHLLIALKPLLHPGCYEQLIHHTIAHKQSTLMKCVLYGTYLDGYSELLSFAAAFYPNIIGIKNKIYYCLFLLCPLTIPISIRKLILQSARWICFNRWKKLNLTLARIKKTKRKLLQNTHDSRQYYNESQL